MDTKIKVGKYTLNIDCYCMWITEQKLSKDGKEREQRVTGYHRTLDDLLKDFIEISKSKGHTTVEEVIRGIKEAEDQAMQILAAYKESNDDRKTKD